MERTGSTLGQEVRGLDSLTIRADGRHRASCSRKITNPNPRILFQEDHGPLPWFCSAKITNPGHGFCSRKITDPNAKRPGGRLFHLDHESGSRRPWSVPGRSRAPGAKPERKPPSAPVVPRRSRGCGVHSALSPAKRPGFCLVPGRSRAARQARGRLMDTPVPGRSRLPGRPHGRLFQEDHGH